MENIDRRDYFLSTQPFELFGGLQPGYAGIEITFPEGRSRILALPNDISPDGITVALLHELDFLAKCKQAFKDEYYKSIFPQVTGIGFYSDTAEGTDFTTTNRDGSRTFAIQAMASIEGVSGRFVRRLLGRSTNVERLIIVTPDQAVPIARDLLGLEKGSVQVDVFIDSSPARLAERTLRFAIDQLGSGTEAPRLARF